MKKNKKITIILILIILLILLIVLLIIKKIDNNQTANSYILINSETNPKTEDKFLNGPLKRKEIESIEFLNNKDIPKDSLGNWDVSKAQNNNIIAWYTKGSKEDLYKIYIGSDKKIYANPNSSYLFSSIPNINFIKFNNNFDTSKVTNMSNMFYFTGNNSEIFELDVKSFDTKNVTDMSDMFNNTGILNPKFTLDISNFDTKNVTNMRAMFMATGKLSSIFTLNVSRFDTSKVTNMGWMFCQSGYTNPNFQLNLKNFETKNVENMWAMFMEAGFNSKEFNLDLSNFKTEKLRYLKETFYGVGQNTENIKINIKNLTFDLIPETTSMFGNLNNNPIIYVLDEKSEKAVKESENISPNTTIINCAINSCP